jgi:membrane protease YdiL (CAAX protease family)
VEPVPPSPAPPPPAPSPGPAGGKSAAAFFGVLVGLGLPGLLAQAASPVLGLAWSEVFAFLAPALVVSAGSNLRPAAYLRLGRARPGAVVLGLFAGAAGYLAASALVALATLVLPEAWSKAGDLSRLLELPGGRGYAFAAEAALLAPACEEIAFRGYLQTTLALRRRPAVAIGVAALLFATIHLDPVRFPGLLALGALFGWLAWRAGSIWPAIAAHVANNATAAALFFLVSGREAGDGRPSAAGAAALLVVGLAGVGAVAVLYRAATPSPPPPAAALALRDPSRPSIAFSVGNVPPAYAALWVAGAASLALLVLLSAVRALS